MNCSNSIITLLLLIQVASPTYSSFAEVYLCRDSGGKEYFCSNPNNDSAQIAKLPPIAKESVSGNIDEIENITVESCKSHGGVDCSQGPDSDGSVLCLDGFTKADLPYRLRCLESKLGIASIEILDVDGTPLDISKNPWLLDSWNLAYVRVHLRNNADIAASKVNLKIVLPDNSQVLPSGGSQVEPFGLASYTFPPGLFAAIKSARSMERVYLKLSCGNCPQVTNRKLLSSSEIGP